jgi:cytoskeletal protein RodZ
MNDFGAHLKQAREQRGISLRQISSATKISTTALEALERDDFSRLPGGIFSRAFVRAYAIGVGLDPEETVQEFLAEYEEHANSGEERMAPEVTADDRAFLERQRRAARWLRASLIAILLVSVAVVVAWRLSGRLKPQAQTANLALPVSDPAPAPPATADPVSSAAPPTSGARPDSPVTSSGAAPNTPAASPVSEPILRPAGTTVTPDDQRVQVHLEATADCWVRATVDGRVDFQEILHAGEKRDIKPGREVRLQVGNAGALKWGINGRNARTLGAIGQIANVRVTSETLANYVQ